MASPLVYVDRSKVAPGRLEDLRVALKGLAAAVEQKVPRAISYNVFFSDDGQRMTVVHVQPDSKSLERHMEVIGPLLAPFKGLVSLERIDVYGSISPKLKGLLDDKTRLLGGSVEVHTNHVGFWRGSTT